MVTLSSEDDWYSRDYRVIEGGPFLGLSDLLSDHVLRNTEGTITMTLDGLYSIKVYHHDTNFGEALGSHDIVLTDGMDANSVVFSDVPTSGTSVELDPKAIPAPNSITTRDFNFFVSGGSQVKIDFVSTGQGGGPPTSPVGGHMSFNRFELTAGSPCDFDGGGCVLSDINLLMAQGDLVDGVSVGSGNLYDLDNDVDVDDITKWLSLTGTKNGYGSPALHGDTDNLDNTSPTPRSVDITDFQNFLGGFTGAGSTGEVGNFDGNGVVDITDFSNFFLPSFAATGGGTYGPGQSIPEPSAVLLLGVGAVLVPFSLSENEVRFNR